MEHDPISDRRRGAPCRCPRPCRPRHRLRRGPRRRKALLRADRWRTPRRSSCPADCSSRATSRPSPAATPSSCTTCGIAGGRRAWRMGRSSTIQKDVEDLEAVRRHFKVEKFVPVGYSYLGFMVVLYAMAHEDRVERLVQLGPVPRKFGTEYPASLRHRDSVPVIDSAAAARIDSLSRTEWAKDHQRELCEEERRAFSVRLVGDPSSRCQAHGPLRHAQRVAGEPRAPLRVPLRRRAEARRASRGGGAGTSPGAHHPWHLGSERAVCGRPRVGDDAAERPPADRRGGRPPGDGRRARIS